MKVIIIIPSFKAGGLERVATMISNYLALKKQYNISIITLSRSESPYHLESNIKIIQPSDKFKNTKFIRIIYLFFWIRKQFDLNKPDTVLSFGETYNSFVILSSFLFKHKVLVSNRASPMSSLKGMRGFLNPIFYRYANKVIIQTNKAKKILESRYKISNMSVIPNPINQNETYAIKKRNNEILNVGRIGGNKNQNWLLNYFFELKNNKEWKLSFVGDGPNRVELEKLSKSMQLEDYVTFYGIRKDVDLFYSRSSIFAFTSTSEGFPNSLAEAMAHGMAVVSFDCIAGPSDLIDDGVNGYLIPVGNHTLFKRRIRELMENENLRKNFGKNARLKMLNFESSRIFKQYEEILREK